MGLIFLTVTIKHFFASQTSLDDSTATLPNTDLPANHTLHNRIITVEEVRSVLQTLKLGKSSGPDNINDRILKEISYPISEPLCTLLNYSLSHDFSPKYGNKQIKI